ncbi:bZIP transcription factor 18 isoform X1 [Cajanus cajan]|uniref:Transcription factor RF2b n=1 Tax=Cajanus cajan TaxID=3821 RepID=A0A151SG54_CAJCA|nr:bZIP transcription factor 18 isoform X1 [Cajanus cajan]KYP53749.1 Transcription factor RF2b [Cajanus cajan]
MSFPHHRRSQSELHFRISDDFDLEIDLSPPHFQDPTPLCQSPSKPQSPPPDPAHRRSNSADASSSSLLEGIEAKKALSPDKLAQLWTVDPKRAKRILANRQSAARSKERKACYVSELERKFQSLQTEATALSAQLSLFQRDTSGLTTENTELKLRLQAMEQQAKLCDALNEALKKEVDRLRFATGEMAMHTDSYGLGMHQLAYNQPSLFSHQSQHRQSEHQAMQMPQFHSLSSNVPTSHESLFDLDIQLSEMLSSDSIGQFQGLDIGNGVSHVPVPDCSSISVNKINNPF